MPDQMNRRAMQWQHTRCRIVRAQPKDRVKGVPDIGHATEEVWNCWTKLTELMHSNQVRSVCVFGTLVNENTFTMFGRGPENINLLIGASSYMHLRLLTHFEEKSGRTDKPS